MKTFSRALIAIMLVCSMAAPTGIVSQPLPGPLDVIVSPGTTPVVYYGQTIVFTTTVTLRLHFEMVSAEEFDLNVQAQHNRSHYKPKGAGGYQAPPGNPQTIIYWQNQAAEMYNDEPPEDWTAGINTVEGGWTEK